MDDVMLDWMPHDGGDLIDADWDDDGEGWLPVLLPDHRRDTSMDDWIC
jgi:hypothetical protein